MAFEFYAEHELSKWPEYHATLHELRDEHGQQMMVIHMDVDHLRFSPSVMKRIKAEFAALRECTDVPIFAFETSPNDHKFARFLAHVGLEPFMRGLCADGRSCRCFVSKKKNNNEHDQHQDHRPDLSAVGGSTAVSSAGVPGSL